MEETLEVFVQPYDPRRPQVCLDEGSTQLVSDTREPLAMEPGKVKRVDYEYEREGFCSIFLACEPLTGKTVTSVNQLRTKADFAHFIKYLVDDVYPEAEQLVLVMDNLNTHTPVPSFLCISTPLPSLTRMKRHHNPQPLTPYRSSNGLALSVAAIVVGRCYT